jgi:hypothetical protein
VPLKPPAPSYISSNSTHIIIEIKVTEDTGGGAISAYELYIDNIQAVPNFRLLSSAATTTRTIEYAPPVGSTAS